MEEKEEAGKKKPGVLRIFHRNGTEQRLVQEIRNSEEMTVSEVSSITNNLGEKWKASNSKVRFYSCFRPTRESWLETCRD